MLLHVINMAEEKILTVNLRRLVVKKPRIRRAKQSLTVLRKILKKIAKTEKVTIDKKINEKIWSRGAKKPMGKLKIKLIKVDDKSFRAELEE